MPTDYTRGEIDVVIDLIRQDNQGRALTSGQVTFGPPSNFTPIPGFQRNTVVVATSIPDRGYRGSQTFYYNRVKLPQFVPPGVPEMLYFVESSATKISDLLPEINSRLNINLTVDKIVEQNLPVFGDNDSRDYADVYLMMRPNSLVYTDQLTIRITRDAILLTSAIPDPSMDGLIYAPPPLA